MQIVEIQYFGAIEWISTLVNFSDIRFSTAKRWKKEGSLNRMWVAGSNNLICLSVPLVGGRSVNQPLRDVCIAYTEAWQRVHWRTVHDCYRKAPWFDHYAPGLELLYQRRVERLVDWNRMCLDWVLKSVGLNSVTLTESTDLVKVQDTPQCFKKPLLEAPHAYPRYYQVFEDRLGFVGNLSIVDLIFCEGPGALSYLKKMAAYINAHTNAWLPNENP